MSAAILTMFASPCNAFGATPDEHSQQPSATTADTAQADATFEQSSSTEAGMSDKGTPAPNAADVRNGLGAEDADKSGASSKNATASKGDATKGPEATEFRSADGCDSVQVVFDNTNSRILYQGNAVINFPCRIDRISWIPGEKTIVYLATAHVTSPVHLYATDLNTNLTRDLTPFSGRSAADFTLNGKHNKVLVFLNLQDKLHLDKCLVDTKTGALQLQEWNMKELESYDLDSHSVSTSASSQTRIASTTPSTETDAFANAKDESNQLNLHWNQTAAPQNFSIHYYSNNLLAPPQSKTPALQPLEGQQKIRDENPDLVKNAFVFLDPSDPRCKQFKHFASKDLKPWTSTEITALQSALNTVANAAPVLILRAMHGQKIYLARSEVLYRDPATVPPLNGGDYFEACAADNEITIADIFFTDPHRDTSIAHELAHLVDIHGHYSLSTEFVCHAAPRIEAFRQIIKLNRSEEVSTPIDEHCTGYFGLPCSYAATNLREAFAELVSQAAFNPLARKGPVYALLKKWVFTPPGPANASDDLMLKAILSGDSHRIAESKQLLDQVIKADPNWLLAYDLRARALSDLEQPLAALVDSDKAIALAKQRKIADYNYDISQLYFHRYQILRKLHRHKEALVAIKQSVATSPGINSQFLWGEIQAYDDLGDGQRALPIADQLVKDFPNDMQNYLLRVFLRIDYFHSRNIQADLDKAASLKNNGTDCTLMRAICLQKLNKLDQALPLLDQVIKDDQQNGCALFHRGQCYQDMHKYVAAIDDYTMSGRVDSYYASIVKPKIVACTAALKGHPAAAEEMHIRARKSH